MLNIVTFFPNVILLVREHFLIKLKFISIEPFDKIGPLMGHYNIKCYSRIIKIPLFNLRMICTWLEID